MGKSLRAIIRSVLEQLSRRRSVAAMAVTLLVTGFGYVAAYSVVTGRMLTSSEVAIFWRTVPWLLGLRLAADYAWGLHEQRWRYVGLWDTINVAMAVAVSGVVFGAVARSPLSPSVPWSVVLVEVLLSANLLIFARLGFRVAFELAKEPPERGQGRSKRTLVVGAGEGGNLVSHEAARYPEYGYKIVGFVDDDESKVGAKIRGVRVLGPTSMIPSLVEDRNIETVLVAIPSADPDLLRRITALSEEVDVALEILPLQDDSSEGQGGLESIRDIKIHDLLARPPVSLDMKPVQNALREQTVLITGAAGSIGSELARQIVDQGPSPVILLDQTESDLFMLARELRSGSDDSPRLAPVICDILNRDRLERILVEYQPDTILHAAAYKHVPLLEKNPEEAVVNNVFGTLHLARAAGEQGVGTMVLISTDKAVEPSNIMGATKRIAELIVLACHEIYSDTSYRAVRFGNVIGSQGSVLPIFRRQLDAGRPLTVTDPEVNRFFMTAREASQLVLQAAVLETLSGQIGMLEMGDPVKIVDLARNLIRLSPLDVEPDDFIEFTGLRPGEKLSEKLVADHETSIPTEVPKVHAVRDDQLNVGPELLDEIDRWHGELAEGTVDQLTEQVETLCRRYGSQPSQQTT